MEFENLLTLIKTVSESELTSFTMKDGDLKISMEKEKQVVVEQTGMQVMPAVAGNADTVSAGSGSFNGKQDQQEECQPEGKTVKAPLVGTFYAASAPDAEAFVSVGDTVKKGTTIGYIGTPTKYYSKEGSNLYFAMKKDGKPIDPIVYLP